MTNEPDKIYSLALTDALGMFENSTHPNKKARLTAARAALAERCPLITEMNADTIDEIIESNVMDSDAALAEMVMMYVELNEKIDAYLDDQTPAMPATLYTVVASQLNGEMAIEHFTTKEAQHHHLLEQASSYVPAEGPDIPLKMQASPEALVKVINFYLQPFDNPVRIFEAHLESDGHYHSKNAWKFSETLKEDLGDDR